MRPLAVFTVACALLLSFGLACGGTAPPRVATVAPSITVADVYERMSAAMTQPYAVFHTIVQNRTSEGPQTYVQRSEIWLDVAAGRARSEVDVAFSTGGERRATWIIDGHAWYQAQYGEPPAKREANVCRGAPNTAVSLISGCRGSLERSTTRVEWPLTFDDGRAVALVTSGSARGAGEAQTFVDHLYIDAETYLPIALTTDGTIDGTVSEQLQTVARFENGFVPKATLPADFFDPAAIGYVERQAPVLPTESDAGVAIYWPGQLLAAGDGLPSLSLRGAKATAPAAAQLLGYRAYLEYGLAADEFAPPEVTLREWRNEDWAQTGASRIPEWTSGRCVRRTEVALDLAETTVFSGYRPEAAAGNAKAPSDASCPSGDPDRFIAEVRADQAVVLIDASSGSAYNSAAGLTAIARALTRPGPPPPDD